MRTTISANIHMAHAPTVRILRKRRAEGDPGGRDFDSIELLDSSGSTFATLFLPPGGAERFLEGVTEAVESGQGGAIPRESPPRIGPGDIDIGARFVTDDGTSVVLQHVNDRWEAVSGETVYDLGDSPGMAAYELNGGGFRPDLRRKRS